MWPKFNYKLDDNARSMCYHADRNQAQISRSELLLVYCPYNWTLSGVFLESQEGHRSRLESVTPVSA